MPVKIQFVASFSPVVADPAASTAFYRDGVGLTFEGGQGDYVFTDHLGGVKHLGLWPLADAAQACFGAPDWPAGVPVPQASIEFEVATPGEVASAAAELVEHGHQLLHGSRVEPWGQVITRLLSPEGLITGVCFTPWFHDGDGDGETDSEAADEEE